MDGESESAEQQERRLDGAATSGSAGSCCAPTFSASRN